MEREATTDHSQRLAASAKLSATIHPELSQGEDENDSENDLETQSSISSTVSHIESQSSINGNKSQDRVARPKQKHNGKDRFQHNRDGHYPNKNNQNQKRYDNYAGKQKTRKNEFVSQNQKNARFARGNQRGHYKSKKIQSPHSFESWNEKMSDGGRVRVVEQHEESQRGRRGRGRGSRGNKNGRGMNYKRMY